MVKKHCSAIIVLALCAAVLAGCKNDDGAGDWKLRSASGPAVRKLPPPYQLLLPGQVRIHPFTGTTFTDAGGVEGIEARVEVRDRCGDAAKAFGNFRFELFVFRPEKPDPRGRRVAIWEEKLIDARKNLMHWDKISRCYKFRLGDMAIPVGVRYVLRLTFSSPFTERLFSQTVFVSGE